MLQHRNQVGPAKVATPTRCGICKPQLGSRGQSIFFSKIVAICFLFAKSAPFLR
jgi:hypothetical protein